MFGDLLGGRTTIARRRRSLVGGLSALLMLPALLAVMACFDLPAPIGDPEKSRIDPVMNGIWLGGLEEEDNDWIWIFEPFDKRTWLVTWLEVEASEAADRKTAQKDGDTVEPGALPHGGFLQTKAIYFEKAWLTEIGGSRFLVFEPKVSFRDNRQTRPEIWWTMRVRSVDEQSMAVQFIDPDYDGFSDALEKFQDTIARDQVGKIIERVIRKHIDDPKLFLGEEEFARRFQRLRASDHHLVVELLHRAGIWTGKK